MNFRSLSIENGHSLDRGRNSSNIELLDLFGCAGTALKVEDDNALVVGRQGVEKLAILGDGRVDEAGTAVSQVEVADDLARVVDLDDMVDGDVSHERSLGKGREARPAGRLLAINSRCAHEGGFTLNVEVEDGGAKGSISGEQLAVTNISTAKEDRSAIGRAFHCLVGDGTLSDSEGSKKTLLLGWGITLDGDEQRAFISVEEGMRNGAGGTFGWGCLTNVELPGDLVDGRETLNGIGLEASDTVLCTTIGYAGLTQFGGKRH